MAPVKAPFSCPKSSLYSRPVQSYLAQAGLKVGGQGEHRSVTFAVKNTGNRSGTEIAQVYVTLPNATGEPYQRLAGWQRVDLTAGETKTVTVSIDPRLLGVFDEATNSWKTPTGTYRVNAGSSSAATPLHGEFQLH